VCSILLTVDVHIVIERSTTTYTSTTTQHTTVSRHHARKFPMAGNRIRGLFKVRPIDGSDWSTDGSNCKFDRI